MNNDLQKMMNDTVPMPPHPTGDGSVVNPLPLPPNPSVVVAGKQDNGMTMALSALPDVVVRRISTIAARYGIRHDSDPMWALVEAVQDSLECTRATAKMAAAVGASANEVNTGVEKIQSQIFQGAVKAGNEIKSALGKEIDQRLTTAGTDLVSAINTAADLGSQKIEDGAKDLIDRLDHAIDERKQEGVNEFSKAASKAALRAARAASTGEFLWSMSGIAMLLTIFSALGAGAEYMYLNLRAEVTPKPMLVRPSGVPACDMITLNDKQREVCEIQ